MPPLTSVLPKTLPRTILINAAILIAIYFIPALSHLAPFPLYLLDPMRIFMLAGYVLTRQNTNAYLLALTIPLFSSLLTGHPPLFKAILISIELTVNILVFVQLLNRTKLHIALVLFVSIIGSKLLYYALKFACINYGFVEGDLITTDLWMQLGTTVFVTLIFTLIWIKSGRKRDTQNRFER
jgi:hypothetical protein